MMLRGKMLMEFVSKGPQRSLEKGQLREKRIAEASPPPCAYFQTFCVERRREEGAERRGKAPWHG